jgi:hypothetical protein
MLTKRWFQSFILAETERPTSYQGRDKRRITRFPIVIGRGSSGSITTTSGLMDGQSDSPTRLVMAQLRLLIPQLPAYIFTRLG